MLVLREEQIALTWADFDRKRGLLRVSRARLWGEDKPSTKTHHACDLELLQRPMAVLQRQRARTELTADAVFMNPITAKPWADEQVQRRYFQASTKRLGLRHRAPKYIRHSALAAMVASATRRFEKPRYLRATAILAASSYRSHFQAACSVSSKSFTSNSR